MEEKGVEDAAVAPEARPRRRRKRPRGPESAAATRPLLLAENHNEVLPWLHWCIRKRRLPFSGLALVHVDAHPDLMLPRDLPMETCFKPRELYARLESSDAGIAEWILPAVVEGHVEKMLWVRPQWARQLPDGWHEICVGRDERDAVLRVSNVLAYFLDDDLVARQPLEDAGKKALHLQVSPLDSNGLLDDGDSLCSENRQWGAKKRCSRERPSESSDPERVGGSASLAKPAANVVLDFLRDGRKWILDICLDYFCCANPFHGVLKEFCSDDVIHDMDYFFRMPLHRRDDLEVASKDRLEQAKDFHSNLNAMESAGREDAGLFLENFRRFYRADALTDSVERFIAFFLDQVPERRRKLLWVNNCVHLPSQFPSRPEILEQIRRLKSALGHAMLQGTCLPEVVTIARSAEDGFCPRGEVEWIQEELLKSLRDVYGELARQQFEANEIH